MSKKRVIIPNNLSEDFLQDTTDKDIKVNIDEVTIKRRNDDKLYVDRNELNLLGLDSLGRMWRVPKALLGH